ncbi:MAG: HIT family protein [Granulosicoccus sp.]
MSMAHNIDPVIAADTFPVHTTAYSCIRLMNDSRWPWLIVLPRDSDSHELHHLGDDQRQAYLHDIQRLSSIVQNHTRCRSVNIAMLGNVVPALHCHVVARNAGDPNWPKPIWGFEKAIAYTHNRPESLIQAVQSQLEDR